MSICSCKKVSKNRRRGDNISFSAPLADLRLIGIKTDEVLEAFYGGSRVICNQPPTDTDCDIVILVTSIQRFKWDLDFWWIEADTPDYDVDGDTFRTYRRGEHNIMVFDDPTEYGAILGATALAKHLNIKDKKQRYALFEKIRSPWR